MKKRLFLFLLLSSNLHAFDEKEVISQLQSLNSPGQDCSQMSNDEIALQCAHEVCGPPAKISAVVTPQNANKYLSPANQQKLKNLESKLKEYYTKLRNDQNQFIQELEKRMKSPSFQDVSTWKDDDFQSFLPFFISNIDLEFDYASPPNQRKAKSKTPATDPYAKVHQEIVQNLSVVDHPYLANQLGIISTQELRPILIERLYKIQQTIKSQNKSIAFNFEELNFGLKSGAKSDNDVLHAFLKLEGELKNKGIVMAKSLCQEQCKNAIPYVLKTLKIEDLKKQQKERNSENIEDIVAVCKASFVNANLENARFADFNKIWPEVKNGYIQNVLPQYSSHSQGLLKEYLENGINFLPSSPEAKKFPDINQALSYATTPYHQSSTAALVSKAVTPTYYSSEDPEFSCPLIAPRPLLWDLFASKEYLANNPTFRPTGVQTGKDNILISPFSCEHAQIGKGIIAHEIGHAITHVMSRPGMSKSSQKKFIEIRNCATSQFSGQPKTQLKYFKDDKMYTEEDTADLMSYMAIRDPQSLYGCGLLYPSENSYNELNVKPHLNDNHTSGMVRLIREMQYKTPNKIPATCQEILKRNKNMFGKVCF